MPTALLTTKLYIPPPRPDLVPRPRLLQRLDAGLGSKLTLLSAPPGFGKTTLLSEWIGERSEIGDRRSDDPQSPISQSPISSLQSPQSLPPPHFAWLSLDEGDNDPTRFLAYLIAAVQTALDGVGEAALAMLRSPQPPAIEPLLTDLINELTERLASPPRQPARELVLVLDDYHVITAWPVHDALAFLIDHLPPRVHLTIATRADPPLPLARLRAQRELNELRAANLRFSPAEATAFLNDVMGLALSADEIATLDARTEGWITGLQMAALSMRGRKDAAAFIRAFSGSHRFVLDYLVEETLDRQPPDVREFLLKTSILERMNAPLCDAVLEIGDQRLEIGSAPQSPISDLQSPQSPSPTQAMLKRLEQANLFVIPLDDERCWYRYHHLFADLLRNQLALTYPGQSSRLHRRASEWFEAEGRTEEAIAHAFAAPDHARAARLVESCAREMLHQSKYSRLSAWIEALPQDLVRTRPWLCVYQAWTRHWTGDRAGGEACLAGVERALSAPPPASEPAEPTAALPSLSPEDRRLLPGYMATVRAHYALTEEDIPRVLEEGRKAMRLLPADDYFTRGVAGIALGGAYWGLGDAAGAERTFAECAGNALKGGYRLRASSALCYAGMQQVKQARLRAAEATFREALSLAQGPGGRRFPNAGYPLAKLGELACEWNDLETARRQVDEGMGLCTQLGHIDLLAEACAALARVQLAQRDLAGARETLEQADSLRRAAKVDPWIVCWLDECRLRFWFARGDLDAALRWAEGNGLRVDGELSYHYDLHHINLARLLVVQGQRQPSGPFLDQALGLLARLLEAAARAGWITETIRVRVLQALAHQARDDHERALAALAPALALARPAGYVRTFIGQGAAMGDLLRRAVARGIEPDYAGRLLAALLSENPESNVQPSPLIEPLSERELQILRLLDTSLSTPEIADQLFVAASTVRTHIKHIYGKLGVHRRGEAVQRARELGLLG